MVSKSSSKQRLGISKPKSKGGEIDTKLLAEAMAYADSLGSLMGTVDASNEEERAHGKSVKAKQKVSRDRKEKEQLEADWGNGADSYEDTKQNRSDSVGATSNTRRRKVSCQSAYIHLVYSCLVSFPLPSFHALIL